MARSQIVENLQVQLGASIDKAMGQTLAKWERDNLSAAGKAAASFKAFDAAVDRAHTRLMSFRNLAVAGVVVGLGALVTRSLNAVDAMADAAEAAGLSTTRYQEMRFAMQFAGVSQETFASSMGRFAKTVGEAAQGNKDIIETFDRLGVKILDANGNLRTQDAILNDTIKALAGVGTQAERSAAAFTLFGREAGSKFAGAISQGSEAIDALIAKARDMNLILSEDMVRAGVAAADKIDLLGEAISTRLNVAVVKATPAIMAIMNAIAWLIEPVTIGPSNSPIDVAIRKIQELEAQAAQLDTSAAADDLPRTPDELAWRNKTSKEALLAQAAGIRTSLFGERFKGRFPGDSAAGARNPPPRGSDRAAEKWIETQRELYDAGQDFMRSNLDAEDAIEQKHLTRRMEALASFERQKFEARQAYEDAVDRLDAERVEKEKVAAERVADAWGGALRGIVDSIDILFDRSMSRTERLTRFALDAITRIAEAAATQLGGGQDPYRHAGGWIANALGGLFGGGGSALPIGGIHGNAAGGPIMAGQPTIVGERGPELIVPSRSGTVIPNHALGGVTQNFIFHVGTGASEAAQVIRSLMPEIERRARAGVERDILRGRGVIGTRA